jgi:hypothetical protein
MQNRVVRVITWNMGMARESWGRPGVHEQAWHYLLGLGPDIAFVQEALPPQWVRAEGTLIHGPFTQWGSAMFSPRYPLERFPLPEGSNLKAFGAYLAFASAQLPDGAEVFVASVHARAGTATSAQLGGLQAEETRRPSARAPQANDAILAGLRPIVGERFIVAGDWNTARHQGSEAKDRIGQEFFDQAEASGWFDCVWEKNAGVEVQTWFGTGSVRQDDHVFCDRITGRAVHQPWVATDAARPLGLSLHAPLVVDFDVEPIGMTGLREGDAESQR